MPFLGGTGGYTPRLLSTTSVPILDGRLIDIDDDQVQVHTDGVAAVPALKTVQEQTAAEGSNKGEDRRQLVARADC